MGQRKTGGWNRDKTIFYGSDEERIEFIARTVMRCWRKWQPAAVGVEGYAFGAKGRGLTIIHETAGVVKQDLYRREALVQIIGPTELKLYATGNGHASKEEMIAAAKARGFDPSDNDNLADAFLLAVKVTDTEIETA
jgi:Holliday junction resolvasome RuvABC endonuclease subunit